MHDHIAFNKQHPTQRFHKNLKNPQIFLKKPKNLGLMHEMHEKKGIKNTYQRRKVGSRPKCKRVRWLEWRKGVWRERKIFSFERGVRKWKPDYASGIYIENAFRWIKELLRSVKHYMSRYESVEVLSRIYRRQKFLDGSRFCRKSISQTESFSMDREAIETYSRKLDGSNMR